MEPKPRKRARLSTVLRQVAAQPAESIQLAELAEIFADRAFGALMFLFAIPNLIPLPPGSSAVLGAPLVLIAAQLALGRRVLWLPEVIARRSIRKADYERALSYGLPYLRRTERLLAPRLTFMFGPVGDRLIGITCLLMALVLFLPIPFANMVPALSIAAFALGLMQRDGAAAILGWIAACVSLLIVVVISGALWLAIKAFFHALGRTLATGDI